MVHQKEAEVGSSAGSERSKGSAANADVSGAQVREGPGLETKRLLDAEQKLEATANALEIHLQRCFQAVLPAVEQCVQRLPAELKRSRVVLGEAQRELSAQRQQLQADVKWAAELPTFEAKLKDMSVTVLDLTEDGVTTG